MRDLISLENPISPMSDAMIEKVRQLEKCVLTAPQLRIKTEHTLHAGLYARTIVIPAGCILTGVLIKIPTVLIVCGNAAMICGSEPKEIIGFNIFAAGAPRKAAFVAKQDTHITMLFATEAQTVEEAERQFTDEGERLFSRHQDAINVMTGTI